MCNGLLEAGGELVWVYDPDPPRSRRFCRTYPGVTHARTEAEVLEDPTLALIASAAVPCERGPLGLRAMDHGKDYFTDKPPFTTFEQLEAARRESRRDRPQIRRLLLRAPARRGGRLRRPTHPGRRHWPRPPGDRPGPPPAQRPHRPAWFWDKQQYGGILVDIGSHQIEQFLDYAGAQDARVLHSKVANYHNPEHPEFEDFGDATLVADNGATFYFRVDWFTPDGLGAWGDGRTIVLGTDGYLELRKYLDVARDTEGDHVYLVDHPGEHHFPSTARSVSRSSASSSWIA